MMHSLTIAQAAERLGYAKETVRKLIAAGVIPAARLPSGRLRVRESDIAALLRPVEPRNAKRVSEMRE